MLDDELNKGQRTASKDMIKDGKVSEVNALFLAGDTTVGNLGKDPGKFYETLQDKSPAEVKKFRDDFEAAHGVSLDTWMMSKATSDGEKRDFKILLEGNYARMEPDELAKQVQEDPQALIQRVKDLHEAARGGAEKRDYDPIGNLKREIGNDIGNALGDSIGDVGGRLDARLKAVTALEDKLANGETLSTEDNQALIDHMRYMAGDQKGFTETKTKAAETVGEVGGKLANVAVTGLTGSTTAGELAEGAVKLEVLSTIDPARTGLDKVASITIETLGNAGMSAVAGKFGKNPLGEAVIEGAGGGLVSALANTQNWNDPGKLIEDGLRQAGTGALTGVTGLVTESIGGEGLMGSLLSAGAETAVSGDLSKSGFDLTVDTAKSAATSLAQNKAKAHHDARNPKRDTSSSSSEKPVIEGGDADIPVYEGPAIEADAEATAPAAPPPKAPPPRRRLPRPRRPTMPTASRLPTAICGSTSTPCWGRSSRGWPRRRCPTSRPTARTSAPSTTACAPSIPTCRRRWRSSARATTPAMPSTIAR